MVERLFPKDPTAQVKQNKVVMKRINNIVENMATNRKGVQSININKIVLSAKHNKQ